MWYPVDLPPRQPERRVGAAGMPGCSESSQGWFKLNSYYARGQQFNDTQTKPFVESAGK